MMAEQQTALSAITNNFTDGATVASQVSKVFENVIAMTDSATNAAVRGVTDRSAFADTIKRCESILPTASQVSNIFADIERQREIFKMFESAADTSWMESAIRNLSMSSYEPPAPVTFRPAPRVQPEPLENARTYLQRLERNIESLEAEGKQVHLSYGLTPETVVVVIQLSSTDDPHYVRLIWMDKNQNKQEMRVHFTAAERNVVIWTFENDEDTDSEPGTPDLIN